MSRSYTSVGLSAVLFLAGLGLTGCPPNGDDYELGFDVGFAEDEWYWEGYDDSLNTLGFGPILYEGDEIPAPTSPEYDRGYWDGVWYAYNDGYFVAYDDAFTVGFSEGYDAAFFSGYLGFLATDDHVEYLTGGWDDGYNDGFSEGRVFGANDYEQGLPFDWLDALLDYRDGTDLCFEEVNVCTGVEGPVILYEYGVNPEDLKSLKVRPGLRSPLSVRKKLVAEKQVDEVVYRPLTQDVEQVLDVSPETTERSARPLTLDSTWLERIQEYRQAEGLPFKAKQLRAR